jgi:hypothetical protein
MLYSLTSCDWPAKCYSQTYFSICATIGDRAKTPEASTVSSSARSAWKSQSSWIIGAKLLEGVYHSYAAAILMCPALLLHRVAVQSSEAVGTHIHPAVQLGVAGDMQD